MTPDAARALADHFQERCDQMGPEHPETGRLGRLVSAVRDLAGQVETLTTQFDSLQDAVIRKGFEIAVNTTPPKRKKGDA